MTKKEKVQKRSLQIISISLLFFTFLPFLVKAQNSYPDKIYQDFEKYGLESSETEDIMDDLIFKLEIFQENISFMASKKNSISRRRSKKDETLKLFVSNESIIEVSSLRDIENKRPPRRLKIESYLDRILTYRYNTVTLFFDDRFSASRLTKKIGGGYEISISYWQYFVARNGDGVIQYIDKTKKKAFFTVIKSSSWEVKLNEVKVVDTKFYEIDTDY